MTDIGNEFRTYMQTKSGITNLCSTRMRADRLAENETLPAVVYTVISSIPVEHLTGSAGICITRVQVDCFAATRLAANALAEAVRINVQKDGGSTLTTSWIHEISCEDALRHGIDPPTDGSSLDRYIASCDYKITHAHSLPT